MIVKRHWPRVIILSKSDLNYTPQKYRTYVTRKEKRGRILLYAKDHAAQKYRADLDVTAVTQCQTHVVHIATNLFCELLGYIYRLVIGIIMPGEECQLLPVR
jgi:hypothetical protein